MHARLDRGCAPISVTGADALTWQSTAAAVVLMAVRICMVHAYEFADELGKTEKGTFRKALRELRTKVTAAKDAGAGKGTAAGTRARARRSARARARGKGPIPRGPAAMGVGTH